MARKIVFPTNFSLITRKLIIDYVNEYEAHKLEPAEYFLLHAYNVPKMGQHVMIDMDEHLHSQAIEDLERESNEINKLLNKKIEFKKFVRKGKLLSVLHKFDRQFEIDLIIIAIKRTNMIQNLLSDTRPSRMINSLLEPVLFVPAKMPFKFPKKLMFATDLMPFENKVEFSRIIKMVQNVGASIDFVFVNKDLESEKAKEQFNAIFGEIMQDHGEPNCNFVEIQDKEIEKSLSKYATENDIDMIALVEREDTFLQRLFRISVLDNLSKIGRVPMLVINDKTEPDFQ